MSERGMIDQQYDFSEGHIINMQLDLELARTDAAKLAWLEKNGMAVMRALKDIKRDAERELSEKDDKIQELEEKMPDVDDICKDIDAVAADLHDAFNDLKHVLCDAYLKRIDPARLEALVRDLRED